MIFGGGILGLIILIVIIMFVVRSRISALLSAKHGVDI